RKGRSPELPLVARRSSRIQEGREPRPLRGLRAAVRAVRSRRRSRDCRATRESGVPRKTRRQSEECEASGERLETRLRACALRNRGRSSSVGNSPPGPPALAASRSERDQPPNESERAEKCSGDEQVGSEAHALACFGQRPELARAELDQF